MITRLPAPGPVGGDFSLFSLHFTSVESVLIPAYRQAGVVSEISEFFRNLNFRLKSIIEFFKIRFIWLTSLRKAGLG
jgi:hypothetical protein